MARAGDPNPVTEGAHQEEGETLAGARVSCADSCFAIGGTLPSLPRNRPSRTNAFPSARRTGPACDGRADRCSVATRAAASSRRISVSCASSIAASLSIEYL